MENRDYAIIGENIRRLRKEKNYTQETFAEKLRISVKHVSRIENEEAYISLSLLLKIKHFFSVDANELLEPHAGKKNKMPTERRKLTQEKSPVDIEAFLADCTEKEKEILLRNLWHLRADLRSVEDGYNRDR
ncbi:MAG: helix-turn-helix domain-containing protein [Mediterraneibacter gnavus]